MRGLTVRQATVMELLDAGLTIPQIAKECRLTDASIRAHIGRIIRKIKRGHYTPPLTPIEIACQNI